jgi:type III secretory pathway component EscS
MKAKLILQLLSQIHPIAIGITAISFVFLFFSLKSRFLKKSGYSHYSISIYALVFYLIGALAFTGMNTIANYFYLRDSFYIDLIWLLPFALLCSVCGALIGYLIQQVAALIANEFQLKLIHFSLLFLVPMFLYLFLVKPYSDMVDYAFGPQIIKKTIQNINELGFKELSEQPNQKYSPAVPMEMNDSIGFFAAGKQLKFQVNANGFSFQHKMQYGNPSAIYFVESNKLNYLCLLIVHSAMDAIRELWIIDRNGFLVYKQQFEQNFNQLAIGENETTLLLKNSNSSVQTGRFLLELH